MGETPCSRVPIFVCSVVFLNGGMALGKLDVIHPLPPHSNDSVLQKWKGHTLYFLLEYDENYTFLQGGTQEERDVNERYILAVLC